MTDRELDARIAAQHHVINTVDAANANIAACALPRPDDVRRLLALQDAVGDLSAALSHGHDDMSTEWALVAAIAQSALEAGLVEESRRTATGCDHCDGTGQVYEICDCSACEYGGGHNRYIRCANCQPEPGEAA